MGVILANSSITVAVLMFKTYATWPQNEHLLIMKWRYTVNCSQNNVKVTIKVRRKTTGKPWTMRNSAKAKESGSSNNMP